MMSANPAIVAVVAAMAIIVQPALAGECVYTKRGLNKFSQSSSAYTVVHNDMSSAKLKVEISRDGKLKKSVWLAPGESLSHTAGVSEGGGTAKVWVQLYPDPGRTTFGCGYWIKSKNGGDWVEWMLPEGQSSVCSASAEAAVSCSKDYNKDKSRYRTDLRVADPS
ncbi:MAG: hypothetical protein GC201_15920 [Alphaproteobacteria bacterium]|nr:hypothetical protein [Alphaproteobacteria bacterium]